MIAADRAGVRASTRSIPTGGPSANISRVSKSKAWASTLRAMWARRRCGAWCWATPTCSRHRQLEQMKALVREAMRDGAVGVSTSLQYAPAPYAKTEELIALAARSREVRRHLRDTHAQRRRRGARAIDEAVRIGREAHIPVEIWHLKAAGKANLGTHAGDRRAS